jgi:hypothetical protein
MKSYYLKATGDVCYHEKAITFPIVKNVPIGNLAVIFFGENNVGWQLQFGWVNQPRVLVFEAEPERAELFQTVINRFYDGFIVKLRDW